MLGMELYMEALVIAVSDMNNRVSQRVIEDSAKWKIQGWEYRSSPDQQDDGHNATRVSKKDHYMAQ